ncbi:uncharacterized protein LOC144158353 isoform X2 [Haemaphysalis longicornis]
MPHATLSMPRSCVVALSLDAACSQGVSCSHYTQTAITTSTIGTQCSLTSLISAGSQTEAGFGGDTARTTASMPHATLSMPRSCVVALPLDTACSQGVSCSHYSQTAITRSTIVLEVNNTQVGDSDVSDNFTTSPDGADISAEPSPRTSSCDRHAGNAGGKPHSSQSCQQCNHPPREVKLCARKMCCTYNVSKKRFLEKSNLGSHQGVHSGEKPYECTTCQKSFTERRRLVVHERLHSGERPYVCSTCQKSFTERRRLVVHERLHSGERPYVCSTCQKSFTQRRHLVVHERLHSGERPHVCSTCQKSFIYRASLAVHERSHSGEKPYVCSTCQKSFAQRSHLVVHERLHSGERSYVCSTCQKSFTQRANLVFHERSHSGARPYVCSTCQQSFTRSDRLLAHKRLHSEERPYVCSTCQKSYKHRSQLVVHERLHSR